MFHKGFLDQRRKLSIHGSMGIYCRTLKFLDKPFIKLLSSLVKGSVSLPLPPARTEGEHGHEYMDRRTLSGGENGQEDMGMRTWRGEHGEDGMEENMEWRTWGRRHKEGEVEAMVMEKRQWKRGNGQENMEKRSW